MLQEEIIRAALQPAQALFLYESLDSTQEQVRRLLAGQQTAFAVLSDAQHAGRGRLGRSFFSPPGTGLYLTWAFPLPENQLQPQLMTLAAGLVVCKAVDYFVHKKFTCMMKWPNDILINDKKICGILATLSSSVNELFRQWVLIGVGINVTGDTWQFPEEIRELVGTVQQQTGQAIPREMLSAHILNGFYQMIAQDSALAFDGCVAEVKQRLCTLGRQVSFSRDGKTHSGTAVDLLADGSLLIQTETQQLAIQSGEVLHKR